MKKLLSVLLSTVMFLACVPLGALPVSAATSGTTGDCMWTLDGTHLTISGNGVMGDYNYNYDSGPWGNSITAVTIEDGVTTIGDDAFYYCFSLTSVTIGNSVTTIGDDAFYNCTSLESVTIPNSVTTIGNYAFYYCTSLESVTIGNSVTTIGNYAFYYCISLGSMTIGSSVAAIGEGAFFNCASLGSVTIPDSVTIIGDYAFWNCTSLNDVYYCGDATDRAAVDIGDNNGALKDATWHYNWCIHVYDYVCDAACNECGAERDAADHVYGDVFDPDCDVCGAVRADVLVFGDADGDGAATMKDAACLQQYLNGWDTAVDHVAADGNGDGKLNNQDLVLLIRYLSGWARV